MFAGERHVQTLGDDLLAIGVHAIARTRMNPKLEHRLAHARMITEAVELGCTTPSKDTRLPNRLTEGLQPRIELSGPKKTAHFVRIRSDT